MTELEQVEFIKAHPRMGTLKISQELNVSYRSVRALIVKHGIERFTNRPWTFEDDEILMQNFATMSIELLTKKLDRTRKSIEARANNLCIYRKPKALKNADLEYDKMLNNGRGVIEIAPGHKIHRMGW